MPRFKAYFDCEFGIVSACHARSLFTQESGPPTDQDHLCVGGRGLSGFVDQNKIVLAPRILRECLPLSGRALMRDKY